MRNNPYYALVSSLITGIGCLVTFVMGYLLGNQFILGYITSVMFGLILFRILYEKPTKIQKVGSVD